LIIFGVLLGVSKVTVSSLGYNKLPPLVMTIRSKCKQHRGSAFLT